MTMPNFLILGAAKAGTTALYYHLRQHPQIYMSPIKETNFFALEGEPLKFCGPGDQDYINRFSVTELAAYCDQFQSVSHETAIGEASPLYLYSSKACERIQHYLPDVKLIAMLRNPVDRAYSAFLHLIRDGREPLTDFAEALRQEEARIDRHWEHIWHYKNMGFYAAQLTRYLEKFSQEQLRVYLYKDFRTNPLAVLQDIYQFLGIDQEFVPDMSWRPNVSTTNGVKPKLSPAVKNQLIEEYRQDILNLQDLLHWDLQHWLKLEAESTTSSPLV